MIKLHLGCNKRFFGEDWIHIDMGDFPHLNYPHTDVFMLPPEIKPSSVDVIYASHVLEYCAESQPVLTKWYNLLKPDGLLRLAVPDFDAIVDLYSHGWDLDYFIGLLYGRMTVNDKEISNKTVFNYKRLYRMLVEVGFSKVRKYDWRETEHARFDDCSQAYLPHFDKESGKLMSLNVEAIK